MAGGKRTSSGEPASAGARRRPPTIDLTATEIASEPGPAAPPSADPPPDNPPPAEAEVLSQPETADAAGPPPEPPPTPPPEPDRPPPARNNPWLLVASGVGGAAVVIVVLVGLWASGLIPGRDSEASALAARLAGLEARLRELAARPVPTPMPTPASPQPSGELANRLAKLEAAINAPRQPAIDPALSGHIATMEKSIGSLAGELASVKASGAQVAASAADAQHRADAAAAAAKDAAQAGEAARAGTQAVDRREIEAMGKRLAALEQTAKTLQDDAAKRQAAPVADPAVRLALVADALNAAVSAGAPYQAELSAAKSRTPDAAALAPLEAFAGTGLPPRAALLRELQGLIPAMDRAAGRAKPVAGGFLDKLQASAERLVRVRPIGETKGDDAGAMLGRIETAAMRGDLAGAFAELRKLPVPVRAPAEAWIAKAQQREAALAASRRFAATALAALSKPTQ